MTRALLSLVGLTEGKGVSIVPIVWLIMWSAVDWSKGKRESWIGNKRIAMLAGCDIRAVRRAKALMVASGMISGRWSRRKWKCVKVWTLAPDAAVPTSAKANPAFRIPGGLTRRKCREQLAAVGCDRPAATTALAWALYACASMESDARHPEGDTPIHVPMVALCEMTGTARANGAFYRRLATLERAGVISRTGDRWADGIIVHASPGDQQHTTDRAPVAPVEMMDCRPKGPQQPPPPEPEEMIRAHEWPQPEHAPAYDPSGPDLDHRLWDDGCECAPPMVFPVGHHPSQWGFRAVG